ncbi:hypothetical protein G6O67_006842 [Ophiocordyceps sinensis]|uniref:Uncharacterized protein n=1 Tax=Ophiocordyceps sinensis TaxID=72228 RepID=A0A8H4PLB6_9HYPO|nr:hypothetical protein G6O67_006842 [Ophiocordyceps sinensis]
MGVHSPFSLLTAWCRFSRKLVVCHVTAWRLTSTIPLHLGNAVQRHTMTAPCSLPLNLLPSLRGESFMTGSELQARIQKGIGQATLPGRFEPSKVGWLESWRARPNP